MTDALTGTPCIEWTGCHNGNGYGMKRLPGGPMRGAHRVAWIEANGPIPPGMHVLHRCDKRNCINVDHLFLGTHAENMADMKKKGRGRNNPATGVDHYATTLTQEQVDEIRSATQTQRVTAAQYDISQATVWAIKKGKTWKHS